MRHSASFLTLLIAVSVTALLSSCGGGGGTPSTNAGGQSSPVTAPSTIQNSPLLGTTVPVQTTSRVDSISSATASASAADTGLAVPSNTATGDSPVIATSQDGNVLLMQFVKPGQTPILDASSTAEAFARLALGSIVTSASIAARANSAIVGAPEFPNLQSLVLQALQAGTPPANSASVLASLSTLVSQVQATLAPQLPASASGPTKSAQRARPLGETPPPLPYVLLPGGVLGAVSLIDNRQATGVQLNNYSLVAWSGYVTTLDGTPDGVSKILPPISPLSSFISVAVGGPVVTPTPLPASSSQFVVGIKFDSAAQTYSFANIIANEAGPSSFSVESNNHNG